MARRARRRPASRVGVSVVGDLGARHRRRRGRRGRHGGRPRGLPRRDRARPAGGGRACAPGWATPGGPRRCTTPRGRCRRCAARGLPLAGITSDTALAAYLVRPDQRSYDLADLVLRNLQRELRSEADSGGQGVLDFSADGHAAAETRHGAGPRRPRPGRRRSTTQLEATGGAALLSQIELPLVDVLARMEQHRHRRRRRGDDRARGRLRRRRCARPRTTPTTRSAASRSTSARPSSCRWCCSTPLGMPKTKRTKTGYTTDADALDRPLRQDRAPVPRGAAAAPRRRPGCGSPSRG